MFTSVDLPLPDAPTRAVSSERSTMQVKALQRLHLDALGLVDADQPVADDQRARTELGVPALPGLGVQFLQRGRRHGIAQLFLLMPAESRRRGRAAT